MNAIIEAQESPACFLPYDSSTDQEMVINCVERVSTGLAGKRKERHQARLWDFEFRDLMRDGLRGRGARSDGGVRGATRGREPGGPTRSRSLCLSRAIEVKHNTT
eukprot:scaffold109084_cov55-Phaeocystis_antarctica.AAC.1